MSIKKKSLLNNGKKKTHTHTHTHKRKQKKKKYWTNLPSKSKEKRKKKKRQATSRKKKSKQREKNIKKKVVKKSNVDEAHVQLHMGIFVVQKWYPISHYVFLSILGKKLFDGAKEKISGSHHLFSFIST